mmetsp:Transcript_33819/g.71144  ORF Transcript_33819/g.71144 Transcript_33819/m.71144 type:complete len:283 (+) Transcript_33819:98-946(+)
MSLVANLLTNQYKSTRRHTSCWSLVGLMPKCKLAAKPVAAACVSMHHICVGVKRRTTLHFIHQERRAQLAARLQLVDTVYQTGFVGNPPPALAEQSCRGCQSKHRHPSGNTVWTTHGVRTPNICHPAREVHDLSANCLSVLLPASQRFEPPIQGGDFGKVPPDFSHCSGVFATIERAWIGPASSSCRASLTSRWRAISGLDSKASETTTTLKWVSDPAGTLCPLDSLITSRTRGAKAEASFVCTASATGEAAVAIVRRQREVPRGLWKSNGRKAREASIIDS